MTKWFKCYHCKVKNNIFVGEQERITFNCQVCDSHNIYRLSYA